MILVDYQILPWYDIAPFRYNIQDTGALELERDCYMRVFELLFFCRSVISSRITEACSDAYRAHHVDYILMIICLIVNGAVQSN